MPVFENFENQRAASTVEERGRTRKSSYQHNDAFIPMAPSAPHDGEIIEYSPNRRGQRPPNRAAISRREQRMRRSKKYTQKINTGLINPFSDIMLSLGDDGLLSFFREGVKSILKTLRKTLRGLWPKRKKKFTAKGGKFHRRKRRPRNRGDYHQRRKQNGNEGKERRNQERPNRNRKYGSKGKLQKQGQGKSENQGNSGDESAIRRGNNANSNSNSNPNRNRNRRRRRRPSSEPRAAKSPRKD